MCVCIGLEHSGPFTHRCTPRASTESNDFLLNKKRVTFEHQWCKTLVCTAKRNFFSVRETLGKENEATVDGSETSASPIERGINVMWDCNLKNEIEKAGICIM